MHPYLMLSPSVMRQKFTLLENKTNRWTADKIAKNKKENDEYGFKSIVIDDLFKLCPINFLIIHINNNCSKFI